MLNRIPTIFAIYHAPENDKHRRVIEAGIQAQQPIIDGIITKGMHGDLADKSSLHNCIALFEKVRKSSRLPIKPNWDFVGFAYLVAVEFDNVSKQRKIEYGIPEDYANSNSGSNALFSLRNASTLNMGRLVKRARREIQFIPILKGLNEMKIAILDIERRFEIKGTNDPEKQRELEEATKTQREALAAQGITDVQINDSALSYVLTKTRIEIPNFNGYVEDKGAYIDYLVAAMAKRLSFGFNPKIADLPNLSYSQ